MEHSTRRSAPMDKTDTAYDFPGTELASAKRIVAIVYALQVIGLFTGLAFIAAVIVDYIKRPGVKGTWLESHVRWQLRTFWFSLLWLALGIITYLVIIGYFIILADGIWVVYRIAKGWIYLNDEKPLYGKEV